MFLKIFTTSSFISSRNQGKTMVSFSLSEELTMVESKGEKASSVQVPREHPFTMQSVGGQTVAVFSEGSSDQITLEGLVVQRAECKPAVQESYMKLKRLQIEESTKPLRLSQQLEKAVTTNYKPVSNHNYNVEYEKKKKEEGKRARADKQKVLEMLFSAFEKHQYYNIKDLVEITKQPVADSPQHGTAGKWQAGGRQRSRHQGIRPPEEQAPEDQAPRGTSTRGSGPQSNKYQRIRPPEEQAPEDQAPEDQAPRGTSTRGSGPQRIRPPEEQAPEDQAPRGSGPQRSRLQRIRPPVEQAPEDWAPRRTGSRGSGPQRNKHQRIGPPEPSHFSVSLTL